MAPRIQFRTFAACVGALTVIAAAATVAPIGAQASISGTATYRERIALLSDAVFEASLEEVSCADAPPIQISNARIEAPGQVPIHFTIEYDSSRIDSQQRYTVRVRILCGVLVLFSAASGTSVLGTTKATSAESGSRTIPPAATLENTNWKLTKLGNQAMATQTPAREISLLLQSEQKRVTGTGGCNRFTGGYTLAGEKLRFERVASTMMACIEGMDVEQKFLKALDNAAIWRIRGLTLELFDSTGKLLAQFESAGAK